MRNRALLCAVLVLAGCSVGSSNPSDGSAPFGTITAPLADATVSGQVSIDALVLDDIGVDKVRVLIDGNLLQEVYTSPFHVVWNTQAVTNNSTHTIRVEASDVAKNVGFKQISVTVVNGPN